MPQPRRSQREQAEQAGVDPEGLDKGELAERVEETGAKPAAAGKKTAKIEKSGAMAWTCPFDGHTNMWSVTVCGGCGAELQPDDETVKAAS